MVIMKAEYARIAPDVKLGRDVKIYAFVNLYGCEIGDESKIGTFVEIQKGASIGRESRFPATPSSVKASPLKMKSSSVMV